MRKTILLLCAILVTLQASAQDPATGFPPYGSFENGRFDAVNRQNLNVNFAIPIVSSPGRGTDFSFAVVYDSLIWKKSGSAWSPVTDKDGNPTWGWKKEATIGEISHFVSTITVKCFDEHPWYWGTQTLYNGYVFTDSAGTRHSFPDVSRRYYCESPPDGSPTGYASDGSGYFLDASAATAPYVLSPTGFKITNGTLRDTNGNFFNRVVVSSTETHWKDTLGRITLKVIKPNTTTIEYHVLNPTGGYSVTTLALAPFIIATNFSCSGVVEYTGTVKLPTSIVLPNGRSYTFTYEATSDPTTDTTGRVSKVILPTGGSYEYDYTGANGGINCDDGTIVQMSRTINDGITSAAWQFTRTQIDSSTWKAVVTNPEANESVFTFTVGRLTSQKLYQGSEGGTPLRTINTTWAANGTPASTTVELENGQQAKTETVFDSFGNLTQIKEYDWGSATPTRTTQMTYESATAYTDRNIRNLLKQRIVREGDELGPIASQTDITYDDSPLESVTGAAQHDDTGYGFTFTVRGNPTSITRGGITRFFTYDSLGNLRQADLDCCQQKQWNYSSTTQYAYPNSVVSGPASGPQLTQSVFYNFDTGLVTSSKNENDKTTTLAYDNLGRLITVSRPDGVQTTTTYDDVNRTVTVETPIQGTDKVRQKTFFDQLGRPFKQCTQDASGTDISCTETEYDEMSRGYRGSNPFTGSASDWTETHFDALGRQTTVIAQDGNSSSFTYAANMVTVTDPTGKQRRSVTDALGRLIQVAEPGGEAQTATAGSGSATVSGTEQSTQVETQAATAGTGSATVSGTEQSTQVETQAATAGTGSATISGSEQSKQVQTAAATAGIGSATISGSEQSKQVQTAAATAGTGSVTVSGSEQSKQVQTQAATAGTGSFTIVGELQCIQSSRPVCDRGTVTVTVNGFTASAPYNLDNGATDVAYTLRNAFNTSSSPVTAGGSGATVTLTAKTTGSGTNYSLSTSSTWWTFFFSQPSYTANLSGSTLTGGQNAQYTTVYDSGTVWVKVNTFTATASYGQGSTSSSIASSLRNILNGGSSPVTAGGTGTTITLTSKTTGASTNYSLTVGRTYDTSNFPTPSFTASRSGSTLTGGADAQFTTVYDSGTVWVEVNGWRATASYGQGSTSSSIASSLRTTLNGASSPVTAGGTGTTITLTSKTTGASTNYSLTVGRTYDTGEFSSPSFTASRSGATLTGGADAQFTTVYDSGTVWVEVNGWRATASYGQGSTSSSIASSLRTTLNGASSPVTAGGTGGTITLTSKATGAVSNYSLTVGQTYDTTEFSSPSFTASRSGTTLTGGADAVFTTVYDSGTVTVTVNGFQATASYGQGSTSSSIASSLRTTLNGASSPVTAGGTGGTITLTSKATGAVSNYSLTVGQTYDTTEFSSPSFTASRSGTTLTGGADAVFTTVYDTGTVWVEVNGFRATANYSNGSTASSIASSLRTTLNGASSPVTAGGTGATITLTSKTTGLGSNYPLTEGGSYDTANFSSASFTSSVSGLSGGAEYVEPIDNNTQITSYTYDVLDNLKQVAQGAQTRTFVYDSLGRLTSVKAPETNNVATSFTYNNFSQVLTRTDPRGVVKSFTYDGLNRLTQVTYSDGTPAVSFAYGTNPASNNKGRLITVTYNGSSNTESFAYDVLGRVTQATKKIDNVNYPVSYAYNLASELSSITYPSGRVVTQSYDGIGRLSAIASGGTTYASGFTFNTAQQVTGFTYDNGVAASFGYSAQRLALATLRYSKGAVDLLNLSYSYAANGQISKITDLVDNGRTVDYSYDPLGRLQTAVTVGSASYAQWGLAWSYDRYGNRTAQNVTAGSAPAPQLSFNSATNRINSAGYSYDAAGNMTNDAVNAYTYDAENHIKTVNGTGATYSYDGAGLRVKKVAGGTTTRYIYSGTKVIAEYVNGTLSKEYIYSGSGLLATLDSGGTPTYHHAEHLSVRVNTNSSGTTVGQQGHYPFGESWYSTSTTSKWQFTSYERDSESSLDYAMFRYDNSRLGRFMTPDPLAGSPANPQSLNRYAYVLNDPTNLVDPLGLAPKCRTVTRLKVTSATFIFGDEGSPIGVRFGKTELVEECVPLSGPGLQELIATAKELQENRKKEGEEQLGQMGPKIGAFTDCVTNAIGSFNRKSGLAVVKFTPKTLSPSLPRTFLFTTPGGGLQAIGAVLFGLSLFPSPDAPLTLPERVIVGALGAGIFSLGTFVNDRALNSELKSLESALGKDVNKCSTLLQ